MKLVLTLILGLLISGNIFCQDYRVQELVSQGTILHDQGRYDEAIVKYLAALDIDKKSTLAMYELAYTYMMTEKYADAIKLSKKVIKRNSDNLLPSYIVFGSSLDLNGKPKDAIKAFEEGLSKFPYSNLLNYNLALTALNMGDYDKAEQASIKAIQAKPTHGSSHIVLANVMNRTKHRVKALLPLYYFLLLEPTSDRSLVNLNAVNRMLNEGIEKTSDSTINVFLNFSSEASADSVWDAAETLISILSASSFTAENSTKSKMELFIDANSSLFTILGELKKDNKSLWWDLYVAKFYDLVQSDNLEAFSYYISQSENSEEVNKWIANNPDKMKSFRVWMEK